MGVGPRTRFSHRLRTLNFYVVLLSVGALIVVGPLQSTFAEVPLIPFLGTLLLLMVPGVVLVRLFFEEDLSGAVMVPVSFAISVGIFALLGVPFLNVHLSLEPYPLSAGAIVATTLVAATFGTLRRKRPTENGISVVSSFSWLWVLFLWLSTVLASVSTLKVQGTNGDMWVYLAWVREFLSADKLALHEPYFGREIDTFSRAQIDGWLLEQAAFSKVSGIDPIELVLLGYLKPTLVVMSLLAFLLPWRHKILELGDTYYMMHPSLLLNPAILVAFLVGLPFLLWRLKSSLAAQLLVGMLLVPSAVCFVPPIATFFGDHIVLPGQLWRLAWPIPPAALLTVGWMIWKMVRFAHIGWNKSERSPRPILAACARMRVDRGGRTGVRGRGQGCVPCDRDSADRGIPLRPRLWLDAGPYRGA